MPKTLSYIKPCHFQADISWCDGTFKNGQAISKHTVIVALRDANGLLGYFCHMYSSLVCLIINNFLLDSSSSIQLRRLKRDQTHENDGLVKVHIKLRKCFFVCAPVKDKIP